MNLYRFLKLYIEYLCMNLLIKNISNLVTCRWDNLSPKKGVNQSDISLKENGFVYIQNDKIIFAGSESDFNDFIKSVPIADRFEIDGKGKTVLPGFVDSHTHLVFSGSRENEYEMRIAGEPYEAIAKAGGGIASTVEVVRQTNEEELIAITKKRLKNFIKYGTTTIEAKSGYGLDTGNELKLLRVINHLAKNNQFDLDIIPTFLGAHSVPPEISKTEYIELVCDEMIPKVSNEKLAEFIDVFCEEGYFDKNETIKILKTGNSYGLIAKLHTDQFNSIGGIDAAIEERAISVDHLEVLSGVDIQKISAYNSGERYMIATLLPGVSYFLDISYQPARELISKNVPVALATDFNPGSCYTENLQTIMSLASVKLKMNAEEIINAVTYNSACALNRQLTLGSISEGKQADLCIFDCSSYKDIIYHFGVNMISQVIKKGKVVYEN